MEPSDVLDSTTEPTPPPKRRGCRKAVFWTIGVFVGVALILGIWLGPIIRDFIKAGFFDSIEKRAFSGDNLSNLKEMHRAMLMYHESEEMLPYANGWMDAIEPRLQTFDMKNTDTRKKLQRSEFWGQKDQYGFAMNKVAEGKYKDDVPPETVLIFASKSNERNAHGDPAKDGLAEGSESAITLAGNLVKLVQP